MPPALKTKLGDLLHGAKQRLREAGIPSSNLDAELIAAFVLQCKREAIIAYPERELNASEVKAFETALTRREKREPLAYIIGMKEFYSLNFKVDDSTLIPRPDSETLIDTVLSWHREDTYKPLRILDICTGSGCLLLSLLYHMPQSEGIGTDISKQAITIARRNAGHLKLAKRAKFLLCNLTDDVDGLFDIVVANPPYVPTQSLKGLEPELAYEPLSALDGGLEGMDIYTNLAHHVAAHLAKNGRAIIEIGIGQEKTVAMMFANEGLSLLDEHRDLGGRIRALSFRQTL